MPTPDEIKKQKELNDLLEQENRILREKLKLQSESYDLSSSLVEELKNVLGIESRRSTFESGILDVNKKINRAIRDQKIEFEGIESIQKQIVKNATLINKAKLFEESLENQLKSLGQQKAEKDANRMTNVENFNKAIVKQREELNNILALSKEERNLRKDEIKELKEKIAKNEQLVESNFRNMSLSSRQFYLTQKQREELEKINAELKKEEEVFKRTEKRLKETDKKLGITSGLLKGLNRTPFLKDLGIDFNEALTKARRTTSITQNGVAGLTAGLKNVGSQLKSSLTNPANITLFVMQQIWTALKNADKATGDLAKAFNMTYTNASYLRQELISIGNSSGDIAVNAIKLQESMIAVGNSLSSNAVLNKKDLVIFTKLREQAGFTNEELTEMQKLTFINGGNLENNVGNLLVAAKTTSLNNKVLLNEKTIMSEVAKTSKAIQLSLGGSGKELGNAVAQVKALGMNMQQVENIAGSLLDFESSISAELEAELLTGKDLNLERARLYAINNDMAGVAREINKQFGSAAEFSHMNRIQQEAAAKAVGMSREELAATLTDQEALRDLSADQVGQAQEALAAARAKGMTEEQIRKTTIDDLMKQQSIQERLNNTTEKLQEVFIALVQPLLPLLDILTSVLNVVGKIMKFLDPIFQFIGIVPALLGDAFSAETYKTGELKGAKGAFSNLVKSANENWNPDIGDMGFDASSNQTIVSNQEGAFGLSKNDDVLAAPNLFNKINKPTTSNNNVDMVKVENLLSRLIEKQERPINLSVEMDGEKVAKGVGKHANGFYTQAGANIRQIS
jgi:hypothetical protein